MLPGFDFSAWYGLFAPAGMTGDQADRLAQATRDALSTPAMRERFKTEGLMLMNSQRAEFGQFIKSEITRWGKIVSATGVKPE